MSLTNFPGVNGAGRGARPPSPASSRSTAGAGAGSSISAALATLKDVAGIAGSFVFTNEGQIFAREMHPMFDDAALAEAAERLTRLHDTFAAVGDHLDLAVIRYQDHRLYLKRLDGGMLCILADGVVNTAALRMAANLVGRRIAGGLDSSAAAQPGAPWPAARITRELPAPLSYAAPPPDGSAAVRPGVRSAPAAVAVPGGTAIAARSTAAAPGTRRFRGRTVE